MKPSRRQVEFPRPGPLKPSAAISAPLRLIAIALWLSENTLRAWPEDAIVRGDREQRRSLLLSLVVGNHIDHTLEQTALWTRLDRAQPQSLVKRPSDNNVCKPGRTWHLLLGLSSGNPVAWLPNFHVYITDFLLPEDPLIVNKET